MNEIPKDVRIYEMRESSSLSLHHPASKLATCTDLRAPEEELEKKNILTQVADSKKRTTHDEGNGHHQDCDASE